MNTMTIHTFTRTLVAAAVGSVLLSLTGEAGGLR
jgi:hypothetical protein